MLGLVTTEPARLDVVRQPDDELLKRHYRFSGYRCHAAPAFLRTYAPEAFLVWFGQSGGGALEGSGVAYERRGRLFGRPTFPAPLVTSPRASACRRYCRATCAARVASSRNRTHSDTSR